ncbi:hypothetical protein OG784_12690 [Streptomyces sp. NBC_01617]|uniref:hypothetical protein n=1 Tax=Streptomyces sp. NBC_01617 TaxID=2975899 RepID=UPI00386C0185|nr:hypothetical protein OG784_12690 [Streptomyces sp. NBC_01617]
MNSDDLPDNVIPLFSTDAQAEKRQQMIETWEALYLRHGQTLTDVKTAASLRVAMQMVELLLNGAQDCDVISDEQRDQLLAIAQTGHEAADEWQR